MARLPKLNEVFIMPQCYIHSNLVPISRLVHGMSWTHERVIPALTGSAPITKKQKAVSVPAKALIIMQPLRLQS